MKEAKELLGVQTRAMQEWDKQGKIRVVRTVGGRRRIPESEILHLQGIKTYWSEENRKIIGYARVSSGTESQKNDLNRQIELIKTRGIKEDIFVDIGSGINENRRNFKK